MPNRVVRSDILESDKVNKLSFAAEVFYRRLMSILDDFGLGDGRVSIIRSKLYPLRLDKVSESDVSKWLTECVEADLVRLYQVDKKPYLKMFNFNQSVRIKQAKYPPPQDNINAYESGCIQMNADEIRRMSETKRNETNQETNNPKKFDRSDYYVSPEVAFEEIKSDDLLVEQLLRIVHTAGFRTCNEISVIQGVKKFLTIEAPKPEFYAKNKSEVKKHLANWMNKNANKLE